MNEYHEENCAGNNSDFENDNLEESVICSSDDSTHEEMLEISQKRIWMERAQKRWWS